MKSEDSELFNQKIKEIVQPFVKDGLLDLESISISHIGIPL